MDADHKRARAASFGAVAAAYAGHRPDYPVEAVQWLVGGERARVLELGAGTGKLTATLSRLGHDVIASDPSSQMLAEAKRAAPGARRVVATAEEIPLPSACVDVVVAAQAFHWFDPEKALPEIARVLRPAGALALVWNQGDRMVPWVKKVYELIDVSSDDIGNNPFEDSDLFVLAEQRIFRHWQVVRRDTLTGFVGSSSQAATLAPAERDRLLADAGALYDSYGRGPDGLLMPWMTYCCRGRVTGLGTARAEQAANGMDDDLLIDFS